MVVTFVRIDDRMIHGQTVTRWAKEKPCDGQKKHLKKNQQK